jgi:copper chaperone CopZ
MRYSNPLQIIVMMLVWAAALLVLKNALTPAPVEQAQAAFPTAQVRMYIRHVGCSEQYKEVVRALKTLPWLGEVQVERGQHPRTADTLQDVEPKPHTTQPIRPEQPQELCTVRVVANVQNVEQADFMELTKTLRDIGIVPATLEFGGISHFALQVKVPDLSCKTCVEAAREALTPLPVSASYYYSTAKQKNAEQGAAFEFTSFRWLDKKSINPKENTISMSVRPKNTARVQEVIRSLERAGFLPLSIRIVVEQA